MSGCALAGGSSATASEIAMKPSTSSAQKDDPMTQTVRTHVVLPKKLVDEIDALVGKRKRSEFIAESLEELLVGVRQRRLLNTALAFAEANPDAGPPEWATSESTREWVRAGRRFESDRERRIRELQAGDGNGENSP